MKKDSIKSLVWFTYTNITTKLGQDLSYDLSEFLNVFVKNGLWNKKPYRTEYKEKFTKEELEKIISIKINIHTNNAPYSNQHNYENILDKYIDINKFEQSKILSSGISEAKKIAVIVVEYNSENKIIDYLTHEEEKDIDIVIEKRLSKENHTSWLELRKIKSIISEFIQFYIFNFHLTFLTHDYEFSFSEKHGLIGFTTVLDSKNQYYETDKIDFFAHYFLHEKENDNLVNLMNTTSKFWHKEIPSIHFFLDALKGNNVTSTNFIKLVFTIESFFGNNTSTDFMTTSISLILGDSKSKMLEIKNNLSLCFAFRNEIVHGGEIHNITRESTFKRNKKHINTSKLFFELKNILTHLFYFYIKKNLYNNQRVEKINHEMIFDLQLNNEKDSK